MNTWVHFTAGPGGCKTFARCIFFFFLQVFISFYKDWKTSSFLRRKTLHSLSRRKKILTGKKSRCSDTYRSESAAYKCTCHRLAVFPSGASDWKEDNHLMSLVRESVVYRQTASVDTVCPCSVPAACCVARTLRGRGNWMDSIKLPLSGVDTHRHTKAHTHTEWLLEHSESLLPTCWDSMWCVTSCPRLDFVSLVFFRGCVCVLLGSVTWLSTDVFDIYTLNPSSHRKRVPSRARARVSVCLCLCQR